MIELTSLKTGWLESRQEWRTRFSFNTDFGEYESSHYYAEGALPSSYERYRLALAEVTAWAEQVAAASVDSEPEVEADGDL